MYKSVLILTLLIISNFAQARQMAPKANTLEKQAKVETIQNSIEERKEAIKEAKKLAPKEKKAAIIKAQNDFWEKVDPVMTKKTPTPIETTNEPSKELSLLEKTFYSILKIFQ